MLYSQPQGHSLLYLHVEGICNLHTNVGQYRTNVGQYRTNVGQYRTNVGQYRTNVGQYRTNVGQYRTNVGQYRTNVGQYRTSVGQYRTNVGQYRTSVGQYRTSVGQYRTSVGQYRTSVGQYRAFIKTQAKLCACDCWYFKYEPGILNNEIFITSSLCYPYADINILVFIHKHPLPCTGGSGSRPIHITATCMYQYKY